VRLRRVQGTDPHNPDSDSDGVTDGAEYHAGLNPLDPADVQRLTAGLGGAHQAGTDPGLALDAGQHLL
jgi:hypothetical protein